MRSLSIIANLMVSLVIASCDSAVLPPVLTLADYAVVGGAGVIKQSFAWVDSARGGFPVTTTVWSPNNPGRLTGVVLLSHGQGATAGLHNFIGEHLASRGYLVAAPDHFGAALGTRQLPGHYITRLGDLKIFSGALVA